MQARARTNAFTTSQCSSNLAINSGVSLVFVCSVLNKMPLDCNAHTVGTDELFIRDFERSREATASVESVGSELFGQNAGKMLLREICRLFAPVTIEYTEKLE